MFRGKLSAASDYRLESHSNRRTFRRNRRHLPVRKTTRNEMRDPLPRRRSRAETMNQQWFADWDARFES